MKYTRNCPECDRELEYVTISGLHFAKKRNSICNFCSQKEIHNRPNIRIEQAKRMMGNNNPNKRLKLRSKISKRMVGNQYARGILRSDEFKENTRKRMLGKNNPHWRSRGKEYTKWQEYVLDVRRITNQQPLHLLENFDRRGRYKFHLDHKKSIRYGFDNGIEARKIANIRNLQMLWWKDNIRKQDNCI